MLSCTQCNNSVWCAKVFVERLNWVLFAVHSLISRLCRRRRWKQMVIKIMRAGHAHHWWRVRYRHPAGMSVALLAWKEQQIVFLDSTSLKWLWMWSIIKLLRCFSPNVSVVSANSIIHGSRRCCSSVLLVWIQQDRSADPRSRRRAPAVGDHLGGKPSLKWFRRLKTASSLTYDDIRLAGASAGVGAEVALDLVSSLIEQIQVVFHWVSIMETLAQMDNTWCRGGGAWSGLSSMLIYWKLPLWRLQIFAGYILSHFNFKVVSPEGPTLISEQICA